MKDDGIYFKCLKCKAPITKRFDLWLHDRKRFGGRIEIFCSNCSNIKDIRFQFSEEEFEKEKEYRKINGMRQEEETPCNEQEGE